MENAQPAGPEVHGVLLLRMSQRETRRQHKMQIALRQAIDRIANYRIGCLAQFLGAGHLDRR